MANYKGTGRLQSEILHNTPTDDWIDVNDIQAKLKRNSQSVWRAIRDLVRLNRLEQRLVNNEGKTGLKKQIKKIPIRRIVF